MADPDAQRDRIFAGALIGIFALALVVRAVVLWQLRRIPLLITPELDSAEYVEWARQIASGRIGWTFVRTHGPGYPFFLAAVLRLFGSLRSVYFVQAALGSCTCVLTAVVARRAFGRVEGVAAGALLAVYAPMVLIDVSLLAEGLLVMLAVSALAVFSTAWPRAAATGLLLGAAIVTRPTAALLFALFFVVLLRRRATGAAALLAFATAAVVAPVTIANFRACHCFIPVQARGGMNFYLGNSPQRNGLASARLGGDWDSLRAAPLRAGIADPALQDRWFTARLAGEIRRAPLGWARLVATKIVWTFQDDEPRDSHSFYFFRASSPLLRALPTFGWLFPLALCGMVVALRGRRPPALLLCGYWAAFALSVVFLVVGMRYRVPLAPALAAFAAGGAVAVARLRERRLVAGYALLILAGIVGSHLLRDRATHNFAEEWALSGVALLQQAQQGSALGAFLQATKLDPRLSYAWDGVGVVEYELGHFDEARTALLSALRFDPDYREANVHLAEVEIEMRNDGKAEEALRRALAIDPSDLGALTLLASLLQRHQRLGEAVALAGAAVTLRPGDPAPHLLFARILNKLQRNDGAATEARAAVTLDPSLADGWLLLAASTMARDATQAAAAIDRAASLLGSHDGRIATARAALARQPK